MQYTLPQCRRQWRMGDDENTVHLNQIIRVRTALAGAKSNGSMFYRSLTFEKNMSSASGAMVEASIST